MNEPANKFQRPAPFPKMTQEVLDSVIKNSRDAGVLRAAAMCKGAENEITVEMWKAMGRSLSDFPLPSGVKICDATEEDLRLAAEVARQKAACHLAVADVLQKLPAAVRSDRVRAGSIVSDLFGERFHRHLERLRSGAPTTSAPAA